MTNPHPCEDCGHEIEGALSIRLSCPKNRRFALHIVEECDWSLRGLTEDQARIDLKVPDGTMLLRHRTPLLCHACTMSLVRTALS